MAHRIDTDNKAVDLFGAGKHGFATPSPPTVMPTTMSPAFANMLQQEIVNTVEGSGLTPIKADNTQLLQAIQILAANDIAIANWERKGADPGFAGGFYGIAYDETTYVVAGGLGEIQTTTDLANWTRQTADASYADTFFSAAFGGGTFVLVGENAGVQYSTDSGATWTAVTLPGGYTGHLRKVIHDGTRFIAAGDGGGLFTSTDGVTWTARTPASSYSGNFFGLAASSSRIVAAGSAVSGFVREIQTSDNGGVTWTRRQGAGSGTSGLGGNAIGYGGGLFLASGSGNDKVFTSADAITWTQHTLPSAGSVTFNSIEYDGTRYYVAVGFDTNGDLPVVYTSVGGLVWKKRRIPLLTLVYPQQMVFDGAAFVAAAFDDAVVTSLRVA